jgi:HlyD family secretion protein
VKAFPHAGRTIVAALICVAATVGCKREDFRSFDGVAVGEVVRLSAPADGNLSALSARRGEKVAEGARLFSIADPAELAARDQAARELEMIETRHTGKGPALDARELEDARAQIAQAEWKLALKSADAPVGGVIVETAYAKGDWVPAGAPVVAILPLGKMRIRFEVPLAVAAQLHSGRRVTVECASCPRPVAAVVTFVSPFATGESAAHGVGELRYGVEARPDPEQAAALRPGQAVTVNL